MVTDVPLGVVLGSLPHDSTIALQSTTSAAHWNILELLIPQDRSARLSVGGRNQAEPLGLHSHLVANVGDASLLDHAGADAQVLDL